VARVAVAVLAGLSRLEPEVSEGRSPAGTGAPAPATLLEALRLTDGAATVSRGPVGVVAVFARLDEAVATLVRVRDGDGGDVRPRVRARWTACGASTCGH